MRTLVTGATGMVGAALVRQLVAQGEAVRILRRPTSSLELLGEAAHRVEHAVGDVTDPAGLLSAMAGVRRVYHVAASLGQGGKKTLRCVNVGGTAHVVDAALRCGVERLVHTSSIAALGRTPNDSTIIDETTRWQDHRLNSAYAVSKHRAEMEIHRGIAEGLDGVMVNPALIFGLARPGENTRQILERLRAGKVRAIPVGGTSVVDAEDVADGMIRAMERGRSGERYILAGEALTFRAMFEILAATLGVPPPRRRLSPRLALGIAVLAEGIAFVSGTSPRFSRSMARTTAHFYRYSGDKAVEELGCRFRPFRETAARLATMME